MGTYRLRDVDLTRHVRTPAGVAYFHKPIGSPIGGGGRGISKVGLADVGSIMDAQSWAPHLAPKMAVASPSSVARPAKSEPFTASPARGKIDPGDAIFLSMPDQEGLKSAAAFWTAHKPSAEDSAKVKTGLGLKFPEMSVRDLRKAATNRKATSEERRAYKTELANRVRIANQAAADSKALTDRLTARIGGAPEDADLAPMIGETLAAHPKLGPLAHVWDRLRLSTHNFRQSLDSKVAADKAGDIAKGVGSVLLAGLLLHLGVAVPGLVLGG